jgi:catechol 2,3-dioxygenase-like lactoylglutathione lyase family enzyme
MALRMQVTFDCADPERLATFWCEVLGYRLPDPPEGFATWQDFARHHGVPEEEWHDRAAAEDPDEVGPRLFFNRVPEGKVAKNRVHLDVNVAPRGTPAEERRRLAVAAAERLVAHGATRVGDHDGELGEFWVVMRDPEGNEFCLQ